MPSSMSSQKASRPQLGKCLVASLVSHKLRSSSRRASTSLHLSSESSSVTDHSTFQRIICRRRLRMAGPLFGWFVPFHGNASFGFFYRELLQVLPCKKQCNNTAACTTSAWHTVALCVVDITAGVHSDVEDESLHVRKAIVETLQPDIPDEAIRKILVALRLLKARMDCASKVLSLLSIKYAYRWTK